MKHTRIMIIEVNRMLREGIKSLFKKHENILLKTAKEITEAKSKSKAFKPDIIMLNPFLPGIRRANLESLKIIKTEFPDASIIVMDILPDNSKILKCIQSGVSGFVLRDASHHEFVNTIRKVSHGEKVFPLEMSNALFNQIASANRETHSQLKSTEKLKLTVQEQDIINLIADGMNNKEIAYELHISYNTVKSRIHNLFQKLSIRSRIQLVKFADTESI